MNRNAARLLAILAVPLLLTMAGPRPAEAFSITLNYWKTQVVRWDTPNLTYYLDEGGIAGVTAGEDVRVINESFQEWTNLPCTSLRFTYLGPTTTKSVLPITRRADGKNQFVWITDSKWTFGSSVLGVTLPLYGSDGRIVEADIAMNGYSQKWTTTGKISWNTQDVKSVAIHEIGHFFGLMHVLYGYNQWDPPTMAPAVDPSGKTATLHADDEKGACFLYPLEGEYYMCSSKTDCPTIVDHDRNGDEYYSGQLDCVNGYCKGLSGVSPGSVEFGGICRTTTDCQSPTQCVALTSVQMCSTTCSPATEDCPEGFRCATGLSIAGDWCIPGSKKKEIGEPCLTSSECITSFCYPAPDGSSMSCRSVCNKDSGPGCPDGQTCWTSAYSAIGGCYPTQEVPVVLKPLDADCKYDSDCKSGLCWSVQGISLRCRKVCDPTAPACYAGYVCIQANEGRHACVPPEDVPEVPKTRKADGEACTEGAECASGRCVAVPSTDNAYCRTPCNLTDWTCSWGTSCVSYGSTTEGACMPSVDRTELGGACGTANDCTTLLCMAFDDSTYCTQNCVDGWCPNDMECVDGGDAGFVCRFPAATEPGGEDTGPQPIVVGTGCSADPANPATSGGALAVVLGLGVLWFLRRRPRQLAGGVNSR
jgi:MYXO-CTERM domain-containing protein